MMKAWAPNGYDLMEWPIGQGYVIADPNSVEHTEAAKEVFRKNAAKARSVFWANHYAAKVQKAEALEKVDV